EGEFGLLLGRLGGGRGTASGRSGGHGHRRGGRDAPLLLEQLHQLGRLHDGERAERFSNLVQVCHRNRSFNDASRGTQRVELPYDVSRGQAAFSLFAWSTRAS